MNTQAAPEWESEIHRSRATLLNHLLLTVVIFGFLMLIQNYVSVAMGLSLMEQIKEMWAFVAGWLIVLVLWLWRGLGYRTRVWSIITVAYLLCVFIFLRGGLHGSGRTWALLPPLIAFVLLGQRPGVLTGIASVLIYVVFAALFTQTSFETLVPGDDPRSWTAWGAEGASFLLIAFILMMLLGTFGRVWLEALRETSEANKELEETNVQLHRQASQLQATTEIVRTGTSTLDPEALQVAVVNKIQERFSLMGVYFVGLFLLDEDGTGDSARFAVLKAATGEAGKLLLEMGYRVRVDETTAVGWCVGHREARTRQGVGGTVKLGTVPMPNTRTEVALPLHSRGRALGTLNVHSTHEAAFSEDDIVILQTLADQIAVAIDNARLFSQTEAALEEVQTAHRRYLIEAWEDFLVTQPTDRVDYTQSGVEPEDGEFLHEARRAARVHARTIATSTPSPGSGEEHVTSQTALVVPLKLREQVIGTIALHEPRSQRSWTTDDITLAEAVAEQVALTVENLRLVDDTQRRAARERLLGDISERMQRAANIETLMRITTEELNRTLGGSRAYVRMGLESSAHSPAGDEQADTGDNRDAR